MPALPAQPTNIVTSSNMAILVHRTEWPVPMGPSRMLSAFLLLVPFSFGLAQQSAPAQPAATSSAAAASTVDLRIAAAGKKIKATPDAQSYNDLAFALFRKGRDSGDAGAYNEAAAALKRSFELAHGNYEAQKLQAALYLATRQYAKALKLATELNRKVPDDIVNWGLLVDASMALGNYTEAERDAQWILDLRAGSALGFEKAAALREVFGDTAGSIEFYDEANRRTSPNDADQHAWYLTRKADLELDSGSTRLAEEVIDQALLLFPDSQLALATLARIRTAQGQYDEAALLLEKKYDTVKSANNLYAWAEAVEKGSHPAQAAALFQRFESEAIAETGKPENADRELIFFYLNQKNDPAKALALATTLSADFKDCGTLDAYAWALYGNGKYSEAKAQMDRALAVGVRNPTYFCHAAQIAAKLHDDDAALKYRKDLADFRPNACPAEQVTAAIGEGKR